jgi:hypothetical protein
MNKLILVILTILSFATCNKFPVIPPVDNYVIVAKGFFKGLDFDFKGNDKCIQNSEVIVKKVVDFIGGFKDFDPSDFTQILRAVEIIKRVQDFVKINVPFCNDFATEIKNTFSRIDDYMINKDYFFKMAGRFVINVSNYVLSFNDAITSFKNNKFEEAGMGFGKILKDALFWDLK